MFVNFVQKYEYEILYKIDKKYEYEILLIQFQLRDWLHDKMAAAQDETYRDAKNLHSKYLRHQAFEREIAANKDRLQRLMKVSWTLV